MVILKKLKGSTLMETLIATVLIVIVFMMASMILNNVFATSIKNNTRLIDAHLNELQYLELNNKLELPYYETINDWKISIVKYQDQSKSNIEFEAFNASSKQTILIISETEN